MRATEVFNKIQRKRQSIEKINSWLSLNPLSVINSEMRNSRARMRSEIVVLEAELTELFEKQL
jgi:hypothetical protein